MSQPDWQQLTDLFAEGDDSPELWDPIFKDLKVWVGSLMHGLNHELYDVDDLVSNTIETMCIQRRLGLFDPKRASVRTWAHLLARQQVLFLIRKKAHESRRLLYSSINEGAGVEEQVLEWISSAEWAAWLREKLLSMPAAWREAFVFRLNLEWLIADPPVPAAEHWLQVISRQSWELGSSHLGKSERTLARNFYRAVRRLHELQLAESREYES